MVELFLSSIQNVIVPVDMEDKIVWKYGKDRRLSIQSY